MRLRRRAVDFVGQQDVGENRPRHEGPAPVARGRIFLDDVRAGDVGRHQVGRELNALEGQAQRLRNGADHQRLRRARQAGDQAMAADEERNENLVEHFFLADDHLADLAENVVAHGLKAFNAFFQFRGIRVELCDGGHFLFPFVGILQLQEQLLRRTVVGRDFERREHVILGLVLLARGEIRPGQRCIARTPCPPAPGRSRHCIRESPP